MARKHSFYVLLVLAGMSGCSQGEPVADVAAAAAAPATLGMAATLPSFAPASPPSEAVHPEPAAASPPAPAEKENTPEKSAQSLSAASNANTVVDIGELFAPPKATDPVYVAPEPEIPADIEPPSKPEVPPPPVRLLGFMEVEGLQALFAVNSKMNVVAVGDSVDGIEIVAMDPPVITYKHGEREYQINLIDQPWMSGANAVAGGPVPVSTHRPSALGPPDMVRGPSVAPGAPRIPTTPGSPALPGSDIRTPVPGMAGSSFPPPPGR